MRYNLESDQVIAIVAFDKLLATCVVNAVFLL